MMMMMMMHKILSYIKLGVLSQNLRVLLHSLV